jgi:hypothetical protein
MYSLCLGTHVTEDDSFLGRQVHDDKTISSCLMRILYGLFFSVRKQRVVITWSVSMPCSCDPTHDSPYPSIERAI